MTFLQSFLLFHTSVLKPDFHLCFIETERGSDLDAPCSSEVPIEVELLLQLRQLFVRKVRPTEVWLSRRAHSAAWRRDIAPAAVPVHAGVVVRSVFRVFRCNS